MSLLSHYLERVEFSSYEDFYRGFALRIPDHFNFAYDVLDVYAEQEPQRQALLWCDDRSPARAVTFAEMRSMTDRMANFLRAQGIGRGDAVMLAMKSGLEFWPAILALHKLQAIAIPATHMLKEHDVVYRLEAAHIKAVLAADVDDLLEQIDIAQGKTGDILQVKIVVGSERAGWLSHDRLIGGFADVFVAPARSERNANSDTMLIYFTSGTTGFPKMAAHNYIYPLAHILTARYWQNVQDGGLHYTVADTGWAKAVWGKLYGQWLAGSSVFVYEYDRFEVGNLLRRMTEHKVTTFCAPPTIYRFMIKEDLSGYDFSGLRYAVVAGEALNPEVYNRFLEKTGLSLREGYGQTELVITTATWPWMEPKPGSMGRPSPGYQIELLDADSGKGVEIGEEGELCVATSSALPPGIFMGYHESPELTGKVWHDGYYHTGDVVWQDEDGYLWFVGRADDVIKSSGYRIGPFEVESVLMQHPAVTECAVTGMPDEQRGQVVKATIVLSKGYVPDENMKVQIQDFVKHNTAPYKYPRIIEFVSAMPKTISGKIRRTELRSRDSQSK